jgi:hypothetical protein
VLFSQAAFIETIREKLGDAKAKLPSYLSGNDSIENIETQVGNISTDGVTDLIAIMMTDKNWTEDLPVGIRESAARYDGIVQVGPVVLTIENKPCSKNIWKEQVTHFSHIQRHYYWSKSNVDVRDYLNYWIKHHEKIVQVNKEQGKGFNRYLDELRSLDMITDEDVKELDELFNQTGRNHIRPCPGLYLEFSWALDQAAALDKRGEMPEQVGEKIKQALITWSQPFAPAGGR